MSENTNDVENKDEGGERTFTQAQLDKIVSDRLKRDREARGDKSEEMQQQLKEAEVTKTEAQKLQSKLSELEDKLAKTELAATKARTQATYGISDEDAELFLIGTDAETIEKQAKALSERLANAAPGHTPEGSNNRPKSSEERSFIRGLTGRS